MYPEGNTEWHGYGLSVRKNKVICRVGCDGSLYGSWVLRENKEIIDKTVARCKSMLPVCQRGYEAGNGLWVYGRAVLSPKGKSSSVRPASPFRAQQLEGQLASELQQLEKGEWNVSCWMFRDEAVIPATCLQQSCLFQS